jgi:hypothetical protein
MAGLPPNFFNLCRTCKKPTPYDRKTLFNEEISAFFDNNPSLKSSDLIEEKLPRVVCKTCFEIMDFVNKFVIRAERVKGELEQIISDDSSKSQTCSSTIISPLKRKYQNFDSQNANTNPPVTKTIKSSFSLDDLSNSTTNYLICKSCKIIFNSVEDATIHQMNHDRVVHICLLCNARFDTPSSLEKHMQEDCHSAEKNAWTCSLCSYFDADWTQVKSHMMAEHNPCNECNIFWRESLATAKEKPSAHSELCSACGILNEFIQEKDSSLPIQQNLEEAGFALENEIVELSQSTVGAKQEIAVETENLSNANPVPYEDAKEVWVVLEKLNPEAIKRAMLGNHSVDLNKVKVEKEEMSNDSDGDDAKAESFPTSRSPKNNHNNLIVKLPKKSDEKLNILKRQPNFKKVLKDSKDALRCKYCSTDFTQQLHYIKHLRQYHL